MKEKLRLNSTTNRREYHILRSVDQDPYPEEYGYYHKHLPGRRGWRKARILWQHQIRMYRTWKHNRKTKWKLRGHS